MPIDLEWRYGLVGLLTGAAAVLAGWALREGLSGLEWLTALLPPSLFTAGVGLFYILLPSHWSGETGNRGIVWNWSIYTFADS